MKEKSQPAPTTRMGGPQFQSRSSPTVSCPTRCLPRGCTWGQAPANHSATEPSPSRCSPRGCTWRLGLAFSRPTASAAPARRSGGPAF
eukprot:2720403-Pyramimonas_sp.AAC.1